MGQSIPRRPMTRRVWHLAWLLDRMIDHFDIGGAAGRLDNGEGLLVARLRCIECPAIEACERFLAEPQGDDVPTFCPNGEFLARCIARREPQSPGHEPGQEFQM